MPLFSRSLVLAGLGGLVLSGPAFAHAHLTSASPAAGAIVASAPTELALTFSEGLNLRFTGVKVKGPNKSAVATGTAKLGPQGDTTLMVPLSDPLAAGTYTVQWHALSTDGHKTTGEYTFSVKPAATSGQ